MKGIEKQLRVQFVSAYLARHAQYMCISYHEKKSDQSMLII